MVVSIVQPVFATDMDTGLSGLIALAFVSYPFMAATEKTTEGTEGTKGTKGTKRLRRP